VGVKESVAAEEIKAIKQKPNIFNQDNRKDALKTSQELSLDPSYHRMKSVKDLAHLEDCFEKVQGFTAA
jgi:hypothetical protein